MGDMLTPRCPSSWLGSQDLWAFGLPIGPIVVPFGGSNVESYKV